MEGVDKHPLSAGTPAPPPVSYSTWREDKVQRKGNAAQACTAMWRAREFMREHTVGLIHV